MRWAGETGHRQVQSRAGRGPSSAGEGRSEGRPAGRWESQADGVEAGGAGQAGSFSGSGGQPPAGQLSDPWALRTASHWCLGAGLGRVLIPGRA